MAHISEKTFSVEGNSFRNIAGIFWGAESEYPTDPFSGIIENFERDEAPGDMTYGWATSEELLQAPEQGIRPLGRGGLVYLDRTDVMDRICESAGESETAFAEAFWDSLGIDISEELENWENSKYPSEGELRNLTAAFGVEAFGTYCPWHAFSRSTKTPWGIYMFLEKLMDWARFLHHLETFPQDPKPPILKVFQFLWILTYRHEQFHFHVESYATRLESALRRPIYRPYVEHVRTPVANTSQWWEEALAQAVVLKSRFVKRTLGIDTEYV